MAMPKLKEASSSSETDNLAGSDLANPVVKPKDTEEKQTGVEYRTKKIIFAIMMCTTVHCIIEAMIKPHTHSIAKRFSGEARGFAETCQLITALLMAPVAGYASDKIGRKIMLIFSLFVNVFALGIIVWSSNVWVFTAGMIIQGLSKFSVPVYMAFAGGLIPKEHRSKYIGYIIAAQGFGYAMSYKLGQLAGSEDNWTPFMCLASAMGLLTMSILYFVPEEKVENEEKPKNQEDQLSEHMSPAEQADLQRNVMIGMLLLLGAQFTMKFNWKIQQFTTEYWLERNFDDVDFTSMKKDGILVVGFNKERLDNSKKVFADINMISCLAGMTACLTTGHLVMFGSDHMWATVGLSMMGVFSFVGYELATYFQLYLWSILMGMSAGMTLVFLPALASKAASKKSQGAALGVLESAKGIGSAIVPMFAEATWKWCNHHEHCKCRGGENYPSEEYVKVNPKTGLKTCSCECQCCACVQDTVFEGRVPAIIGAVAAIISVVSILLSWSHNNQMQSEEQARLNSLPRV